MVAQISKKRLRAAVEHVLQHPEDSPEQVALDLHVALAVARTARRKAGLPNYMSEARRQQQRQRDDAIRALRRDQPELSTLEVAAQIGCCIDIVRRALRCTR